MAEPAEDAALWLAQARAGSGEAVGQALEACRNYLLMIAEKELEPELRVKGGASDLVQQTFMEAHQAFGRFDGRTEEELLAWLRRLLLNNVTDFARRFRETSKRELGREFGLGAVGETNSGQMDLTASTLTPSRHAVANEEAVQLRNALQELPADYQEIVKLRYEQGKSFEEIAQLMNRSENAVRKLWGRAIYSLQERMEGRS